MNIRRVRQIFGCCLLLVVATAAEAQQVELKGGYVGRAPATVGGDELSAQTNLWVLEVDFKLLRLVSVPVTDPKTKMKTQEWVWYLPYRAINRPIRRRADETDTEPMNDFDKPPRRPLFVPEFTLVTSRGQDGAPTIVSDSVIPEAEPYIRAREKRELKNAVNIVREIPEPTPVGAPADDVIYGVAMWRGVDPETDYCTVFMSGFSNGYRVIEGPNGQPLVERRTIMQDFWRPGDKFDQREVEFRMKGEPVWLYRADAPKAQPVAAPANEPKEPAQQP